jgi:hypothetical protein
MSELGYEISIGRVCPTDCTLGLTDLDDGLYREFLIDGAGWFILSAVVGQSTLPIRITGNPELGRVFDVLLTGDRDVWDAYPVKARRFCAICNGYHQSTRHVRLGGGLAWAMRLCKS